MILPDVPFVFFAYAYSDPLQRVRLYAEEHLEWMKNVHPLSLLLQNLSGFRRVYNRSLEMAAMRYEVKIYGTTPFLYSLKTTLIKFGAKKLVSLIKRIRKG